jgi:thiol-disulfide isomerase/thioredoxin
MIHKCYTRGMFCRRTHEILLGGVAFLVLAAAPPSRLPAQEHAAPKSVVDLHGHAVNPFYRPSEKVIVLVFVRTDCPIANRYAPTIQEVSAKYKDAAEFYLVYPVATETSEQVKKHMKEYGYHLMALRDPGYELVKRAETRVTPEAAVFSADGKLLYHGRINDWYAEFGRSRRAPTTQELSDALASAIANRPVAVPTAPAVGCFLPDRP